MKIEHIAIWTHQLETLKDYYCNYFGGKANQKYINPTKHFESYLITFESGARLELMTRPDIPLSQNDSMKQFTGIIHFAFDGGTIEEVIQKAKELEKDGFIIVDAPRFTGDGYFEFVTFDPDINRIEVVASKNI